MASKVPTQGYMTPFMGNSIGIEKLISSKSFLDTMSNRMSRDNMFELRTETSQDCMLGHMVQSNLEQIHSPMAWNTT